MATIDEKAMNGADLKRFAALVKKTASQSAHGMMSKTDKAKLDGIAAGAEVNVQADWNVTDSSSDAFVKNKPTIDTALSSSSTNAVQNKAVKAALDTKVNTTDLASVTEDSEGAGLVGYGTKTDGDTTTSVSVKDALDEIYESIGDGGNLATRVTALEEGKQDKIFVINVAKSGYTFTKDKADADIKAAYRAGKELVVKYTDVYGNATLLPLVSAFEQTLSTFVFQGPNHSYTRDLRVQIDGDQVMFETVAYQDVLTFDSSPTANSENPVYSGGVYTALQGKQDKLTQGTNITISNNTISALDEKVNQTASTENADIPMLLANGGTPSNGGVKYDADLKYNPSTNTLKLGTGTLTATNYSGNAATATNATNDGSGNNIANTYALKTDVMNPHPTIVTTLPTADGTHHGFYFVKDTSSTRENVYTEYIEVQENSTWKWEPIGSTDVTLDVAYLTTTEVETIWNDTSWT